MHHTENKNRLKAKSSNHEQPLFQSVFGKDWDALPPVMKQHYAVRPYSLDTVTAEGHLDIHVSRGVSLMARLTGALVSHSGTHIPVKVIFSSDATGAFHFTRSFYYPDKGKIVFHSRMERLRDNELIEFMRFGVGWKLAYSWDGDKVILQHRGYVWRIAGVMIPIPLTLLLGKGHAEEIGIDEHRFNMWTHTKHGLFGETFRYSGDFTITEVQTCNPS
jgi:Domain of unknown function (DUF4166)